MREYIKAYSEEQYQKESSLVGDPRPKEDYIAELVLEGLVAKYQSTKLGLVNREIRSSDFIEGSSNQLLCEILLLESKIENQLA